MSIWPKERSPRTGLFIPGSDWKTLIGAMDATYALKTDGTVWSLVFDHPNEPDNPTPTRIGNESDWDEIALQPSCLLGMKTDHTLWAWIFRKGRQSLLPNDEPPIQIGADRRWSHLTNGAPMRAVDTDGVEWMWSADSSTVTNHFFRIGPLQTTTWGLVSGVDQNGLSASYQAAIQPDSTIQIRAQYGDEQRSGTMSVYSNLVHQLGAESGWKSITAVKTMPVSEGLFTQVVEQRRSTPLVALKNDGSLWLWEIGEALEQMNRGRTPKPLRLSQSSDWVALGDSPFGGIVSLASDGGLWFWPLGDSPYFRTGHLLAPSARPSRFGNLFASPAR